MAIALFDLDKTLLASDSDYEWAYFLQDRGVINDPMFNDKIAKFDQDYNNGRLDMGAYCKMMIAPLTTFCRAEIAKLTESFLETVIHSLVFSEALATLQFHRDRGDHIVIVTATVDYVARPIATLLDIEHLLATTPIYDKELLTGQIQSPPCYQDGKVEYVRHWLDHHKQSLRGSFFYSDSVNDIPLLSVVDHPIAVNPDPRLESHAKSAEWTILNWTL